MISVGDILKCEREAQGKTVASVAEELCITQSYLRAIETNDVSSLPGTFFYKSFVRQYASLLGLDPDHFQDGMAAIVASDEENAGPASVAASEVPPQSGSVWRGVIRMPDPVLEAANKLDLSGRRLGIPAVAGFVVVLLACSSFYGWWIERDRSVPEAAPQTRTTDLIISDDVAEVITPSEFQVNTSTDAVGHRRVELNLSATEETWLSITSDGKQVFSGVLRPSETKTLSGLDDARMRVGNAGGIEVRLNGREIGPIGQRGEVRVVDFTADDYEIVKPARRPAVDAAGERL